jgi:hypothetical protein
MKTNSPKVDSSAQVSGGSAVSCGLRWCSPKDNFIIFQKNGVICRSRRNQKWGDNHMRLFIAATVAASLFATNLLAAEAAAPLAGGKPAGVQKAQDEGIAPIWFVLGAVVVVGAVVAASSGGNSVPVTTPPTTG